MNERYNPWTDYEEVSYRNVIQNSQPPKKHEPIGHFVAIVILLAVACLAFIAMAIAFGWMK